jgi:hypothetical protein
LNLDVSTAKNVGIKWVLPYGFEIASGNEVEFCENLESGASCISQIEVKTDLSTVLGTAEIKVVVNYET